MIKLPNIIAFKQKTNNAFEREVQNKYEELMQRFCAEVEKSANIGYCGYSEKFTYPNVTILAALTRCKKEIRKQGYRCHMEYCYNPRTQKNDAVDFTISWRTSWFE